MNEDALVGRRILITGASSGIGESVARLAAGQGATVAWVGRRAERVARLADNHGGVALPGDIATPEGARGIVDRAVDAMGGLDTLVNNAGLYLLGAVAEGDPEDWQRMFDTNVLGLLYITQAALPHLTASAAPDIVNVSSVGGRRVARSITSVYSATKFAVQAITDGLRIELQGTGVRVLAVLPGVVVTELGTGTRDPGLLEAVKEKQQQMGLDADAVGEQVVQAIAQPREVSIREIVIMPTAQPG